MELTTSVSLSTTATKNIKPPEPTCMWELHKIPCTASCPAKDSTCWSCSRIGHWDIRCWSNSGKQKDPNKKPPRCEPKDGKQKQTHTVDLGDDYDPQCDEVHVNTTAINIDALTKAWVSVTMPAGIGPNHHGSLWCKVNTGASGNVIPLYVFANCSPDISLGMASQPGSTPVTPHQWHTIDQPFHNLEP